MKTIFDSLEMDESREFHSPVNIPMCLSLKILIKESRIAIGLRVAKVKKSAFGWLLSFKEFKC